MSAKSCLLHDLSNNQYSIAYECINPDVHFSHLCPAVIPTTAASSCWLSYSLCFRTPPPPPHTYRRPCRPEKTQIDSLVFHVYLLRWSQGSVHYCATEMILSRVTVVIGSRLTLFCSWSAESEGELVTFKRRKWWVLSWQGLCVSNTKTKWKRAHNVIHSLAPSQKFSPSVCNKIEEFVRLCSFIYFRSRTQ